MSSFVFAVFRMSERENRENYLIDFNNLNVNDQNSNIECTAQEPDASIKYDHNDVSAKSTPESMAFLCSSQPLYKLLNSESAEADDNNPFDHLDKQACHSDDPFEIVENAALISREAELLKVETGTLISIESPNIGKNESIISKHSNRTYDTPKIERFMSETQTYNSVQNTLEDQPFIMKNVSPKSSASPAGKNRGKAKSTPLNLLKYSLSNTRLDLAFENASRIPRDSSTDDSFDDIWATKPNLIDSQTDIDIESDIDIDIAKLNIPMLNTAKTDSKSEENSTSKSDKIVGDLADTKSANRTELLEKLASIKQKKPQSPITFTDTSQIPVHNQTVDIKCSQLPTCEHEPVTPKSQYSSVSLPQTMSDNTNSLIENLKKLIDQCDDKSKQTTAKYLLDDLSSILTAKNNVETKTRIQIHPPQLIKRQGTFSIEKNDDNAADYSKITEDDSIKENIKIDGEVSSTDPGLSQVVKEIQNVLGSHQNINVSQTNGKFSESSTNNPTYIVVMAQPVKGVGANGEIQRPLRGRSQSLTLKEKPLAAIRASQQKIELSRIQSNVITTPIKRPMLQRRSSFGTITRTTTNDEKDSQNKPPIPIIKPDAPKVIRRRSLQASIKQPQNETESTQAKPKNPILRRRSFQGPSTSSGIRSPSPKPNLNSNSKLNSNLNSNRAPPVSLRSNYNTIGTLTRRKSFVNDTSKESPQKLRTSYGIMKKPSAPPTTRNLKIRVSQSISGRSNAPMRAIVPINHVASALLVNETVSPIENNKNIALITSTPRSISSASPAKLKKGIPSFVLFINFSFPIYKHFNECRIFNWTANTSSRVTDSKLTKRSVVYVYHTIETNY